MIDDDLRSINTFFVDRSREALHEFFNIVSVLYTLELLANYTPQRHLSKPELTMKDKYPNAIVDIDVSTTDELIAHLVVTGDSGILQKMKSRAPKDTPDSITKDAVRTATMKASQERLIAEVAEDLGIQVECKTIGDLAAQAIEFAKANNAIIDPEKAEEEAHQKARHHGAKHHHKHGAGKGSKQDVNSNSPAQTPSDSPIAVSPSISSAPPSVPSISPPKRADTSPLASPKRSSSPSTKKSSSPRNSKSGLKQADSSPSIHLPRVVSVTPQVLKEMAVHELDVLRESTPAKLLTSGLEQAGDAAAELGFRAITALKGRKGYTPEQMRHTVIEYHRGVGYIEDFSSLNINGFDKIMKKHDKVTGYHIHATFMKERIGILEFANIELVDGLLTEMEYLFTLAFDKGNMSKAMEEIHKVDTLDPRRKTGKTEFRVGTYTGSAIVLLLILVYFSRSYWLLGSIPRQDETIIVFRGLGLPILLVWLWGVDMLIWERYRVNYVFIFDFDLNHHNGPCMLEAASQLTLIFLVFILVYLNAASPLPGLEFFGYFKPYQYPLILVFLFIALLIRSSIGNRGWLLEVLGRCFCAPFATLRFRDFFLADQLVSLAIMFGDIFYIICFYSHDAWLPPPVGKAITTPLDVCPNLSKWVSPVLSGFPLWIRMMQCIRRSHDTHDRKQLVNATKYCVGLLVVISSTYKGYRPPSDSVALGAWLTCAGINAVFAWYWDVTQDWGLFDKKAVRPNRYLRARLLYPSRPLYWWGIISDGILRFAWTASLSTNLFFAHTNSKIYATILASIEVYRRGQWNVYRLENEQTNNVGKFRATNYVPLPIPRPGLLTRSLGSTSTTPTPDPSPPPTAPRRRSAVWDAEGRKI